MQLLSILALALSFSGAVLAVQCDDKKTLSQTVIGANKDVSVQVVHCSNTITPVADTIAVRDVPVLEKRQANVCGATCTTNCFTPSGGGPDPNECNVIADALLYDSQNIGPLFTMDPAQNSSLIVMTYRSCETFIVNQANTSLQYCRSDWSSLVDYIAFNCQSTENAHGGNCVASDQRWFVQVQHS
ncbi:hypothetical protein HETIRDRAFT_109064 [Heterobasidion irregulare TC 32-1]|uniref:Uncharacterized protein n=1 Tax=Heterobasidion irregulare (strain TC 32-1) TaxID=747525 RepID=W4JY56_HETIT|nr:uncharacterized protein HETIRDRAFT_109064 [Heterobasidion irregulare TC 32-1]ETW78478.1 hypothetical protein HETIRDRAFT_109064 [Heterobasidion irregulare TC 32-1]